MIRLFIDQPLAPGTCLKLDEKQSHYLLHVMRLGPGDALLLFNGRDGEWRAVMQPAKKGAAGVEVAEQTKKQDVPPDLWLLFAPIKRGHGDLIAEKASELGASRLLPITTRRTVVGRVPVARYRSIATEAAEQCERLSVPEVEETQPLAKLLEKWDPKRVLLFCAEAGEAKPIVEVLQDLKPGPLAVLTGPEGGFVEDEFKLLRAKSYIRPVRLGPRVLRADTAAIAALTLVQALKGDWAA
ncbi:MAG: 16S rRNA (uracil(1498)-N(3))-methyltransferase [Proteobacteria bacterium]|nr:16S rRNA (uracil(1498)-N(3))-methyltransferase [Pseudomonadota bacterium]